jgi:hypothetical protein
VRQHSQKEEQENDTHDLGSTRNKSTWENKGKKGLDKRLLHPSGVDSTLRKCVGQMKKSRDSSH